MVKQTTDEKTLSIYSRQFGHLPDPGWRPARPTPLEAWSGLIMEDDPTPCGRLAAEMFYQCGSIFSCGPLKPLCVTLAKGRRLLYTSTKCLIMCFCGCLIPNRIQRHQRKVVAIIVPQQGLTGSLPKQPGWGLLKMTRLVLYGNALYGPLRGINKYRFLEVLNLSSNRLTGSLPPSLSYLRGLRILDLHGNAFTGNLDDQITKARIHSLKKLTHISLDDNKFDGPFPSSCLKMSWLVELHLGGMSLTGQLPDCCRLANLKVLDLSFNAFTGPIPDFGQMPPSSSSSKRVTPFINGKTNKGSRTNSGESIESSDQGEGVESPLSKKKKEYKKLKLLKAQRIERAKEAEKKGKGSHVTTAAASEQTIVVNLKNQSTLSIQTMRPKSPPKPIESPEETKETLELTISEDKEPLNKKEWTSDKVPCLNLIELKLTRNRLTGSLPLSYERLTNLKRLEFGSNKLTGIGCDER